MRRSGAGPDQVVALVGRTGWAAAGMAVLQRGFRSPRAVVEAQRVPEVPYGQGAVAADAGATAMIDVSDGLLADLGHLAGPPGSRSTSIWPRFEVPDVLQAVAAATGKDPYVLLLTGGEDHALAASFPAAEAVPEGWRVIGRTRAVDGRRDGPGAGRRERLGGTGGLGPLRRRAVTIRRRRTARRQRRCRPPGC